MAILLRQQVMAAPRARERRAGVLGFPPVLFEHACVWLTALASLDLMLTWAILESGGQELNWIASTILVHHGFHGVIVFKFTLLAMVLTIIEVVGRLRPDVGLRLAVAAVVISSLPILVLAIQLAMYGGF